MVYLHAERGVKNIEIEIDAIYYINQKGQHCLDEMKQLLEQLGLCVHMNKGECETESGLIQPPFRENLSGGFFLDN